MNDLADTLERLAEHGAAELYTGELGRLVSAHLREHGGAMTERDLAEYRVIQRRPVRAPFLGHEYESNPPPSAGGVLIGLAIRLFDRNGVAGEPGSAEAMAQLVEVMRAQEEARGGDCAAGLYRGGLAGRLFEDDALDAAAARISSTRRESVQGTTHISVVDSQGNAASLT